MDALATPENQLIALLVGAIVLVSALVSIWRVYRRRRARSRLNAAITAVGLDALQDVLVPDGMGGSLHVDFVLLTTWTVMAGAKRATFHNPQGAMYDRVAAVKQLSAELPVEGRLLFTRRGKFPKGLPRWTMMVESVRTEFPPADPQSREVLLNRYRESWDAIRAQVIPSDLKKTSPFLKEVFLE